MRDRAVSPLVLLALLGAIGCSSGPTANPADERSSGGENEAASMHEADATPAPPTVAAPLDAFWIAPDGSIACASRKQDEAKWLAPFSIAAAAVTGTDSAIAAVTRLNGALDAFWIGPDGSIDTTWANPKLDDAKWHPPFSIAPARAARPGAAIAAVTRLNGALDAFWIGPDGSIDTAWANPKLDDAKWHSPFRIVPGGAARSDSPIAAVTRLHGALDVFWIGRDGSLNTSWANPELDDAGWHSPFPITPARAARPGSPIAAVTRLNGALDAFWIGPDGSIHATWASPKLDDANWHPPFAIAPPDAARPDSPLAAVIGLHGALEVFWIGPDGSIDTTWANPKRDDAKWHVPFAIAPANAAAPDSPLAAVADQHGARDVFWIGPDGAIHTTWANAELDAAKWLPALAISPSGPVRKNATLAVVAR
jgi:hypothetical protein